MSTFTFQPLSRPFPRWMGPFSPARGTRSGFRFHQKRLGTWVGDEGGMRFWPLVNGPAAQAIATLVRSEWGGGSVLFLPNGFVVKPQQTDSEVGQRALIGRFQGAIVLDSTKPPIFNLSRPGAARPGDPWPGPTTTGLECVIQANGSLACTWYHPTEWGRDEVTEQLRGPDRSLAAGFRAARYGTTAGRVRITANGHVITNRQERRGTWASIYVGYVNPGSWVGWERWIERRHT